MRHHRAWQLLAMLVLFAALFIPPSTESALAAGQGANSKPNALLKALKTGALATFDVRGERFRVWVTSPQTIAQLKALKAGTSQAHIPNGRILRGAGKAGFNKPWRWHLDPKDIQMAEMTTEVCDGAPSYVNAHVAEFVDTVKRYCPWSATLVSLQIISRVPAAPAGLQVTGVTSAPTNARETTVRLQWQDRSSDETGYRITGTFTHLAGGGGTRTWDVNRNATRASVNFIGGGFNPVSKACFTVAALSGASASAPSNQVCVTL